MKKIIVFCLLFLLCFSFNIKANAYSAKAAILINADTGETLFENNADLKLAMASTTKIMTALLLCESGLDLNKTVTVCKEAVLTEGTSMGLKAGDTVKLSDLLYGMMLSSGNDAANQAAITVGGSIENFVKLMNERAKSLNLNSTSFETPSGLDGENHFTTCRDLSKLTVAALNCEPLNQAAGTKSISLYYGTPPKKHTLTNHHKLLRTESDVIGVKTGFTKKAGRCLVTAAQKDGKYLIAVTLNDKNDWQDHRNLLDYGFEKLQNTVKIEEQFLSFNSIYKDNITVKIPSFSVSSNSNNQITRKIKIPKKTYKNIKVGDIIGYADYIYQNRTIKTLPITVTKIKRAKKTSILKGTSVNFKMLFTSV